MFQNVYISGPMTGYIEHNYPTFNRAAAILRGLGYTVLNPAEHFGGDHHRGRSEYLRADLKDILQNATAVCLLPGWEGSPGSILEVAVAYNIGILDYCVIDFLEGTVEWLPVDEGVRDWLPEQVVPAKSPDAHALEGSEQPHWWKYQGSILDPTGMGPDIEGVPMEDELTKTWFAIPLISDDTCRVCFHGPHGNTENTLCQELDDGGGSGVFTECNCAEYVDLVGESRITVPDPYNDDFTEDPRGSSVIEERITDEAWRLVMGDRQSAYNHPYDDLRATGRMWGSILTNWLHSQGMGICWRPEDVSADLQGPFPDVEPRIVALMIAMVKVSRESHKHKHDNLVDLIGYALCADRIVREY